VPFDARISKIIVLAAVSFIISFIIFFTAIPDVFELKAYDLFSRHLNPVKSSDDIIIITVDQRSIDAMSKDGITWPWPRQLYVPLIEYLAEADAVFMDIFLQNHLHMTSRMIRSLQRRSKTHRMFICLSF